MAGILSGLLGLFGLGKCDGNKEKDHLLDGPDMYHVPVKPYVEQCGDEELAEKQKELKAGEWLCPECGAVNSGKFCAECGAKKPEPKPVGDSRNKCDKCGWEVENGAKSPKFCPECGDPFEDAISGN